MKMIEGLIGRKIGMTQIFEDNGVVRPVTVLQAGPCVVVQRKTIEKDGYRSVQLGLVDPKAAKLANKPLRGHHAKADVPPTRLRREFAIDESSEAKPGDSVLVDMEHQGIRLDTDALLEYSEKLSGEIENLTSFEGWIRI